MIDSLEHLIGYLEDNGNLQSESIKNALARVDRKDFVMGDQASLAYNNEPLPTTAGQTTSQPSTVVFMLENLKIEEGNTVLDIGGGGAWISCLLGHLVGEKGKVYSFEINKDVAEIGIGNLKRYGMKNVSYILGNAAELWHKHAPYDRIHGAAAFKAIPRDLMEMLKVGGILVAPTQDGNIRVIKRLAEDKFSEEAFNGFVFVPFLEK